MKEALEERKRDLTQKEKSTGAEDVEDVSLLTHLVRHTQGPYTKYSFDVKEINWISTFFQIRKLSKMKYDTPVLLVNNFLIGDCTSLASESYGCWTRYRMSYPLSSYIRPSNADILFVNWDPVAFDILNVHAHTAPRYRETTSPGNHWQGWF